MPSEIRRRIGRIEDLSKADVTCEYAITALKQVAMLLEGGDKIVLDILQRDHLPDIERDALESYLRDEHRWFSGWAYIALLEISEEITTEEQRAGKSFYEIIGQNTFTPTFFQINVARLLYSVSRLYKRASMHVGNFTDLITLHCEEIGRGEIVITRRTKDRWRKELKKRLGDLALTQLRHDCELTREFLISVPTIYTDKHGNPKPPAVLIDHSKCEGKGDGACVYHLRYKPQTLEERAIYLWELPRRIKRFFDGVAEMNIRLQQTQERLRVSYEREVEAKTARARMETLVSTIEGMAHDVGNSLNLLLGANNIILSDLEEMLKKVRKRYSETMGDQESVNKAMQELYPYFQRIGQAVNTIYNRGQEIASLGENILDMSRGAESKPGQYTLQEVIEEALGSCMEEAYLRKDSGIEVKKRYGNPIELLGRRGLIKQMFRNIIQNCCEAMDYKGKLSINVNPRGNGVEIRIEDNGRGMTEEQLRMAFKERFTTKDPSLHKFSGTGLIQIANIVRLHNGSIRLESKVGEGTSYVVCLPYERKKNA